MAPDSGNPRAVIGATHLGSPAATQEAPALPPSIALASAGRTEHFEVSYDESFGETGLAVASTVLDRCERDLTTMREWFGAAGGVSSVAVVLTRMPETARTVVVPAAADAPLTIWCDIQSTPHPEPLQSSFFVAVAVAEAFGRMIGWPAVEANALARVLGAALYPRRLRGFATAWVWLDGARSDVSGVPLPEGSHAATGFAVLFLNYLHHQLGYSWHEIATCPAPTLDAVSRRLGDGRAVVTDFLALAGAVVRGDSSLDSDNRFPIIDAAQRPSRPTSRRAAASDRRVCLLTGASGRLGRRFCERYADTYEFAAIHRRRRPPVGTFAIEADLTADGAAEWVVDCALERFGHIDVLVNAAVVWGWGPVTSEQLVFSAPEQFLTHVVAPLRLTAAAYRRAWSDQRETNAARHRSVVNVSSISGQNVYPNEGQSVYAASKAALDHLSAHMALELEPVGIRVNAVSANSFPSVVSTDRVVDAIVALDKGSSTGGLLVVGAAEDALLSLRGNPDGARS